MPSDFLGSPRASGRHGGILVLLPSSGGCLQLLPHGWGGWSGYRGTTLLWDKRSSAQRQKAVSGRQCPTEQRSDGLCPSLCERVIHSQLVFRLSCCAARLFSSQDSASGMSWCSSVSLSHLPETSPFLPARLLGGFLVLPSPAQVFVSRSQNTALL